MNKKLLKTHTSPTDTESTMNQDEVVAAHMLLLCIECEEVDNPKLALALATELQEEAR